MPAEEFENGILPVQHLEQAIHDGVIAADYPVEEGQLQPASLDLRLGREAWRVQAQLFAGPAFDRCRQVGAIWHA